MTISLKQPVKAFVWDAYLYNMDQTKEGSTPCTIVAASSYVGCVLTFVILVDGRYVFSDMPLEALTWKKVDGQPRKNRGLYYFNCGQHEVETYDLAHLHGRKARCRMWGVPGTSDGFEWVGGEYVTSFDWYTGNDTAHLVKLCDGALALVPNHKINWGGEDALPDYRKARTAWVV